MALKLILLSSHAIENKELSSYNNFKSEIKNTSIKLTKDQIAMVRAWIDQGAKWPEGVKLKAEP